MIVSLLPISGTVLNLFFLCKFKPGTLRHKDSEWLQCVENDWQNHKYTCKMIAIKNKYIYIQQSVVEFDGGIQPPKPEDINCSKDWMLPQFCIACKTSVGWTCCGSGSYFLVKITSMISQIFSRWVLMMSFAFVSITCCRVLQSWAVHIPNQSYQSMQHTDYGLAVKKMFFSKGSLDSVGKWIV